MQRHHPVPARSSAQAPSRMYTDHSVGAYSEEDDDAFYPARPASSAIRYQDTRGNQVIQRGKQRIVIHNAPPPRTRKRGNFFVYLSTGLTIALVVYLGLQLAGSWWTAHQLDATYGFPRTYQTDAIVYPGDTSDHPSHYIFLNLNGTVEIIELPHSDSAHAKMYKGPALISDQAALIPVTGAFRNVGGKVEMLVHIQNQTIVYVNDGTQFKPQQ